MSRKIAVKSKLKIRYATVDKEHFALLSRHNWILHSEGYARTMLGNRYIYMHQLVCPCSGRLVVDHINRNRLDNRSKNLRTLTNHENLISSNRFTRPDKGVSWHSVARKWRARINDKHLGLFINKRDALKAVKNEVSSNIW